jgi:hypothetical protein
MTPKSSAGSTRIPNAATVTNCWPHVPAAVLDTLRPHGQGGERRYLAVFKRQREGGRDGLRYHAHVLVGGSGAAEANRVTILNNTVVVEMLTHRAGDAVCCPTRPSTRRYRLAPRGLVVVKAQVKSAAPGP